MLDFTLDELEVTNQADLDSIPVDYNGRIIIKFGTPSRPAMVSKQYKLPVLASGQATVRAFEQATVLASEQATVDAFGQATVRAFEQATVRAFEQATVRAFEQATVRAFEQATVRAFGQATVDAFGQATVDASGQATVDLDGYAQATKYQNASCTAKGHSRVIEPTKDINTFMDYYSVKHTKTRSIWYKAVHKRDGRYVADHGDFEYIIGKTATNNCDPDRDEDCSFGLHIATLRWALDFGRDWPDLAILEVNVKTADIIVPYNSDGKVRVPELKVVREVPLEECGIFGKMLARK